MNYSRDIYELFIEYKPSSLIGRLKIKVDYYEIDGAFIITTVTDKVESNSYVASPYSLIIDYSKDELVKIESKIQKAFSYGLIKSFASFLHFSKLDKAQTINNYMLSTNFFSKKWEELDVELLEKKAKERYPDHAMIIRSVNKVQNAKLFANLKRNGWLPITSRQVYIFDSKERWEQCHNAKIDKKLLNSTRYFFHKIELENSEAFEEAERLYNLLYLKKYSQYNIHFKAKYLQLLVRRGLLNLYLLHDEVAQKKVGVVGMTLEDGVVTVPIVGYETSYPQKEALYRRLIAFTLEYAFEKEILLNLSSGASEFKKLRGARAELEYMMVKIDHLAFRQKIGWRLIAHLSQWFYTPLLKRLKL